MRMETVYGSLVSAGIAQVSIDKGYKSVLLDMSNAGLERGVNQIATGMSGAQKRKRISMLEKER